MKLNQEQLIRRHDMQMMRNESIRNGFDGAKVLGVEQWGVGIPVEDAVRAFRDMLNEHDAPLVVTCHYIMDFNVLQQMYAIYGRMIDDGDGDKFLFFPEITTMVYCRDREMKGEVYRRIPKSMVERSIDNIIDMEVDDNGVTFIYSNKRSYTEFDSNFHPF